MELLAEQITIAVALPDFVLSAVLVAVIVTIAGEGGAGGAVNTAVVALPEVPLVAIVPMVELPPTIPLTLQVTPEGGLSVPVTVAVKTCAPPVEMFTVLGETVTTRSSFKVTVAEALACASAWLTAVTVTLGEMGSTCGAV